MPSRLRALSNPSRGMRSNEFVNARLKIQQRAYGIMACNSTRELFEKWKEFTNALHILQRELRHIDKESTERVRMSTGEREQKPPRNVCLTRRRKCVQRKRLERWVRREGTEP